MLRLATRSAVVRGLVIRSGVVLGVVSCLLAACSPLLELTGETGAFGPSPTRVRALLEADAVRRALAEARDLDATYPGPTSDALLAAALWRNGRTREAERRFRRAAEAGLGEGWIGLAAERASVGDWDEAVDLAARAVPAGIDEAAPAALLAAIAWRRGDREAAAHHLRSWADGAAGTTTAVARAMAMAVGDLSGPPVAWSGEASELALRPVAAAGLALPVRLGDTERLWLLDLSARQSRVSAELAAAAGLTVRGAEESAGDEPGAGLSAAQAAIAEIGLAGALLAGAVVGVGATPEGTDGVLGPDLLAAARWSADLGGLRFVIGPIEQGARVDQLAAPPGNPVRAWVGARLIVDGVGLQLMIHPRIGGELTPVVLDLSRGSTLDSGVVNGTDASAAGPLLRLGDWDVDVAWSRGSLESLAARGGVAPGATVGLDVLADHLVHWLPETRQLRIEESPQAASSRLAACCRR